MTPTKTLSAKRAQALIGTLRTRFQENGPRHEALDWADVEGRLVAQPEKLRSLHEMEHTGGEPDVVGRDPQSDLYLFFDCAPESPEGRRSLCYDQQALDDRKKNKPAGSAAALAQRWGVRLLTETEYRRLQTLGSFDTKTSSWLHTPPDIRDLGGAIFGDRRYETVFIYHNGAGSYYAARGFRCVLAV